MNDPNEQASELRRRAEKVVQKKSGRSPGAARTMSTDEMRKTIHELQVHEIELEMQNEELRRVQAELESAHSRYFDFYDLAPVGYITVSESGLMLDANLTAAALLNVTRSAMVRQLITRYILKEDQDVFYRHRKLLYENLEPQTCELRMVTMDGTVFWARLEGIATKNVSGDLECRLVMRDITESKRKEEALRESENRFRTLISLAPVGVFLADAAGRCKYANDRWLEMTGLTLEQARGDLWVRSIPPEESKKIAEEWENRIVMHGHGEFEYCIQTPAGKITWVLGSAASLKDSEGHVTGYIGANMDITDRKHAQEAQQRSEILLRTTQQLAGVGGWEWDIDKHTMFWTEETYRIHDFDEDKFAPGTAELFTQSVECYRSEDRPLIRAAFKQCAEEGGRVRG